MSKTTDNSDGAWTYVIVNEVFVPEKIVEGIPSCLESMKKVNRVKNTVTD